MLYAAVRGVIFVGLLLLVGTHVAASLVLSQLGAQPELGLTLEAAVRRLRCPLLWLLLAAIVIRGALQLLSFRDPGETVTAEMAEAILWTGNWGHAWFVQIAATLLFLVWQHFDRVPGGPAWPVTIALIVAIVWAQTGMGHAAGSHWPHPVGRLLDAIHLAGLGIWLGTLAALAIAALPALRGEEQLPALASVVRAFSLYARIGVSLVILTGVVAALVYVGPIATITQSTWGQLLLIKLACMLGVLVLGWYNWRVVTPALEGRNAIARQKLRLAVRLELLLGLAMLLITAFLVASPLPGEA